MSGGGSGGGRSLHRRHIPYKKDSSVDATAPQGDINVTPLVDVCLVLLIIFMVVTPMLGRGRDVKLPVLVEAERHKEGDQVFVSVDETGVYIDAQLYTAKKDFQKDLKVAVQEAQGKAAANNVAGPVLFLKGDRDTNYGRVRTVFEWIKETETIRDVALVVDVGAAPAGG